MFGFFLVLKAELVRSLIYTRRYLFAAVVQMGLTYGLLLFLVLGYGMYSGEADLSTLLKAQGNRLIAFLVWTFASAAIGLFTSSIQSSAETGVLEQLCMSPHGLSTILLAQAAGATLFQFSYVAVLYAIVTLTVKMNLVLPLGSVLLVLVLTILGLYGFAFIFGGLSLLFKRIGPVAIILRITLLPLAFVNLDGFPTAMKRLAQSAPMLQGTQMLKKLMVDDVSLVELIKSNDMTILVANTAAWLVVGLILFTFMENLSRDKGVLGSY